MINTSDLIKRLIEQVAFEARSNEYVDKKSGVSARLTIAALENAVSAAERRAIINQEKNTQTTINNLFSLFHANSSLIRALSKEYCFEYKIFLQPVGPFLERNPFIRKEVNIKNSFRLFKNVFQPYINLTLAARQGRIFPFCDLSNAHDLCENPYVDLTHYSSSMNKKLAELILLNLK